MRHWVASVRTCLRTALKAARCGLGYARREFRFLTQLNGRSRFAPIRRLTFDVQGDYLITASAGLFRLRRDSLQRVWDLPAFGIACAGSDLFLAGCGLHESFVVRSDRRAVFEEGLPHAGTVLYRVPIRDEAERIHQLALDGENLWLANTARNALTKLDARTGEWKVEIAPFTCSFGLPIAGDHNHLNSVRAYDGRLVVFTAFRTAEDIRARRGLLGVCGDGKLRGYVYRHGGIHDIHISGDRIIFSDSFCFFPQGSDTSGAVVVNGQPVAPEFFAEHPMGFVRGVAGDGNEMVIGNSCRGTRATRFLGEGNLVVLRDGKVVGTTPFPAGQIYDVVRSDGLNFDVPPAVTTFDGVCELFRAQFGEPVMERSLADARVHRPKTKRSEGVWGDLEGLASPGDGRLSANRAA